tara:strand:- start:1064 stop:1363 length:300 start_codon:yes stop_codon:yes gene_type:complete
MNLLRPQFKIIRRTISYRIQLARMNADSCGLNDSRERNRMQQQLNGLQEDYKDEYGNEYQPLPDTGSVRTCPECGRAMYYGYCRQCLEDRIKNNLRREY